MSVKFILLNGPKSVGKTTIANAIHDQIQNLGGVHSIRRNMADRLKVMTNAIYGVRDPHTGQIAGPDYLEKIKDIPLDVLGGASFRDAVIYVSEKMVKPRHGKTVFGEWFCDDVDSVQVADDALCVVADLGFSSKLIPLVNRYGTENVILARLSREGTSFDGDSRSYVSWQDALDFNDDTDAPFRIGPTRLSSTARNSAPLVEEDFGNVPGDPTIATQQVLSRVIEMNWLPAAAQSCPDLRMEG